MGFRIIKCGVRVVAPAIVIFVTKRLTVSIVAVVYPDLFSTQVEPFTHQRPCRVSVKQPLTFLPIQRGRQSCLHGI